MTISFRSILMLTAAFLTVIAGAFATVQVREKRRPKQSMQALWLYTCILLALGVLTGIPVYVADTPVTLLFGCISCVCLTSAAACANQRIVWDDRGFWYRTVLRRTVHYQYEDIRRIRPVFDSSPFGADLYMRVGNRRIIIDSSMLWGRFTEAYEHWQTDRGLRHVITATAPSGANWTGSPAAVSGCICLQPAGFFVWRWAFTVSSG